MSGRYINREIRSEKSERREKYYNNNKKDIWENKLREKKIMKLKKKLRNYGW